MLRDPAYEAMQLKLLGDLKREMAGIKQPYQTEEQAKQEAEKRIAHQEYIIKQEESRKKIKKSFNSQTEREYAEAQQVAAEQAQQVAAQQQVVAQKKQGYGGVFGTGFGGGRRRKHKSPRRKNKTRKSRKTQRKVHRLYKSRNRRR